MDITFFRGTLSIFSFHRDLYRFIEIALKCSLGFEEFGFSDKSRNCEEQAFVISADCIHLSVNTFELVWECGSSSGG